VTTYRRWCVVGCCDILVWRHGRYWVTGSDTAVREHCNCRQCICCTLRWHEAPTAVLHWTADDPCHASAPIASDADAFGCVDLSLAKCESFCCLELSYACSTCMLNVGICICQKCITWLHRSLDCTNLGYIGRLDCAQRAQTSAKASRLNWKWSRIQIRIWIWLSVGSLPEKLWIFYRILSALVISPSIVKTCWWLYEKC